LTGIVSWGEGCGRRSKSGVYANVVWYKEWIEQRTAGVPPENPPPYGRNKKNIATGYTSVLSVLIVTTFLKCLIQ